MSFFFSRGGGGSGGGGGGGGGGGRRRASEAVLRRIGEDGNQMSVHGVGADRGAAAGTGRNAG